MSDVFDFRRGSLPLLISVPHDGREIPQDLRNRMTGEGLAIPDTDWHVRRLYEPAAHSGAHLLCARFSRYVADLNRSSTDAALYPGQLKTGLCPEQTFAGTAIYRPGCGPSASEKSERVERYWQPYHDRLRSILDEIRSTHGFALLWDAHSIRSQVPSLFDGRLPDVNIGTNDGESCAAEIEREIANAAALSSYSHVVNGRFRGGYITRHYGSPADNVHAVQLELAQCCYMDESTGEYTAARAAALSDTVGGMLKAALSVLGR